MYAIIRSGGKQYRVAPGDVIDVEILKEVTGPSVQFPEVLFFHNGSEPKTGLPFVEGVVVSAELVGPAKGPKITSVKYKRSHHQYRKFGHRQHYSRVKITEISEQGDK